MRLHRDIAGRADAPALLMGGSLGTTLEMWDGQLPLADRCGWCASTTAAMAPRPRRSGPYEIADLGGDVPALMDELGIERG